MYLSAMASTVYTNFTKATDQVFIIINIQQNLQLTKQTAMHGEFLCTVKQISSRVCIWQEKLQKLKKLQT